MAQGGGKGGVILVGAVAVAVVLWLVMRGGGAGARTIAAGPTAEESAVQQASLTARSQAFTSLASAFETITTQQAQTNMESIRAQAAVESTRLNANAYAAAAGAYRDSQTTHDIFSTIGTIATAALPFLF